MSGRERHPGDQLAALVDGRLGEPDRSRVVDHLMRCRDCLADYDAQLALKGMLRGLEAPPAPVELRERLADLSDRLPGSSGPVGSAGPQGRTGSSRRPGAPGPGRRWYLRSRRRPRARVARAGTAAFTFSVLAIGAGYLLGGTAPGTAVVPPLDQYVREHAAVSVDVPLTEPVLSQLVRAPGPLLPGATAAPGRPATVRR